MVNIEIEDLSTQWRNADTFLRREVLTALSGIERTVASKSISASNAIRNAALEVFQGQRSGREYVRGNVVHRASAVGESPAIDSGSFRNSWGTKVSVSRSSWGLEAKAGIESGLIVGGRYVLGELLEEGTGRMGARPYKQAVINKALPKVQAIYSRI